MTGKVASGFIIMEMFGCLKNNKFIFQVLLEVSWNFTKFGNVMEKYISLAVETMFYGRLVPIEGFCSPVCTILLPST